MKGVTAALCCVLLYCAKIPAQPICGFDQSHRALQGASPFYKSRVTLNEQKIENFIQQKKARKNYQKKETAIFTIPIVVHVLHTGEQVGTSFNPSDEQIIAAIGYLNDVYSGTYPSLTSAGTNAAGDLGLRFVLAKRDPDCNPTSGIERVNMSSNADYVAIGATNNDIARDIAMKEPLSWDRSRYYNIYIVNKINGQNGTTGQFIAGYAYFPTSSIVDGTVMLATQMKSGSKTLPHEMGHAFNLYHPFEGSSVSTKCPVGYGDYVADTDPVSLNANSSGVVNFTCRTGNNACINQPYNIRTESNFMSYTNCYTLFTPGQKDRIQASTLLEERNTLVGSTGALPTYSNPSCSPKINFEQQTAELAETATTVSGCRRYRDYVFNFTIGSDPVQSATAIIDVDPASTALEKSDFDFPSGKNVVFPAGVNNKQSFVLRIYDHGSSHEVKLLRLSFSVDNGGGIAEKGSAITVMNITFSGVDHRPVAPGTVSGSSIGSSRYDINNAKIFDASVEKQRTQMLYKAGELTNAGLSDCSISGIRFFVKKNSVRPFKNLNIKMAHTSLGSLAKTGAVYTVADMTTFLSLPSYTTKDGWNAFVFTQAFQWNGASNVAVELCFDNGSAIADAADILYAYSDGSSADEGSMIENEGINCSDNFSLVSFYQNGIKPVIILDYAVQGNPVGNTISTSREEYLGPYNEVYFYDKFEPQKIIAKIKNLSDWDYGCTTVSIDRDGDGVAPFWNNIPDQFLTRKTFFVTPQNNNTSGNYEITLYYTDAEKLGYESATGRTWANVKMIKTDIPVSSFSPASPQIEKVKLSTALVHGGFGKDHTITTSFNTGFSGFSIGSVDAALPVSWLNFEALYTDGNVRLNWSTATELNNSYFEVEMSTDAMRFIPIGKLASKGNSNTPVMYNYLHVQPRAGKLYYRIKQVDADGKSSYSKVIQINISGSGNAGPLLYPVPAANNNVTIHFGSPVSNAFIEVLSSDMKVVYAERINNRVISRNIYTGNWAAGTYIVKLTAGRNSYILRFVKL